MNLPQPADAFAKVAVRVTVPPAQAFTLFTAEIDRWWRRGPKFRHAGGAPGSIHIEPRLDGRVFEAWSDKAGRHEFELGRVLTWDPPARLVFSWRNSTFDALERTEVDVAFEAAGTGTLVTVCHRGWEKLRADHPARHGMANAQFARSVGMWWGNQLTALREFARRP